MNQGGDNQSQGTVKDLEKLKYGVVQHGFRDVRLKEYL